MNVTLISGASKRRNSTRQPAPGASFSCVLKEGTSVMRPHFLLTTVNWNWNYAIWDGRYYYVTDIVSETATIFRVECKLDVLATFKTQIGNYETLISRAASDQNYDVIDSVYPAKAAPNTKRVAISNPGILTNVLNQGTFLMVIAGRWGNKVYVLSMAQASSLMSALFPATSLTFNAWIESTFQTAIMGGTSNAAQFILSYKWIPIPLSISQGLATATNELYLGPWNIVDGVILSGPVYYISGALTYSLALQSFTFPARDDNGARGKWLYQAPFANYSLYAPPFGMIQIDPSYVFGSGRTITYDVLVEYLTGNATLRLYYSVGSAGPKMIGVYNCNLSCDLKSAGQSINIGGMAAGAAAAAVGYASGDYGDMVKGIASAAGAAIPQSGAVGGGISGVAPDVTQPWYGYATYFDPIDENRAEVGRPLAEVRTIGSLSGFVRCADPHISIPGHEEEMTAINAALAEGIFYE